jgi:hypothetical protein
MDCSRVWARGAIPEIVGLIWSVIMKVQRSTWVESLDFVKNQDVGFAKVPVDFIEAVGE